MEINCDELRGGSYAAFGMKNIGDYKNVEWGFGNLSGGFEEEDEFFNKMSFAGYKMLYESGELVFSNDCVGFGETITVNSLPDDPFCMTFNTFSDWLHENHIDFVSSQSHDQPIDVSSFKLNFFEGLVEEVVTLPEDPFCMNVTSTFNTISDWFHENQIDLVSDSLDEPIGGVDQMMFKSLSWFHNPTSISQQKIHRSELDDGAGEPHDAFELVLPYLEMKEILAVEGVCRSLRDSVRKEPFFWRTIDFGGPFLRCRVTDDSLLKLTRRAQGKLQCLNLAGCVSITDYGLKQVLASNPLLTKLSISGCLRLSTAGLLSTFRDLKSSNRLRVKGLITGGTMYFTKEQFKELNLLLGADTKASPKSKKQRLYTSYRSEFSLEDDRVTDIELCPRCEKPSLVFDCPAETCPLWDHPCPKSSCRACVVCIERCHDCGSCLNDCDFRPFCFPFTCGVCIKKRSNQLQECI